MTCKECRFFIQEIGKRGTCEKRPYVRGKRGGIQIINGEPRILIVWQSSNACKMFEKGGVE